MRAKHATSRLPTLNATQKQKQASAQKRQTRAQSPPSAFRHASRCYRLCCASNRSLTSDEWRRTKTKNARIWRVQNMLIRLCAAAAATTTATMAAAAARSRYDASADVRSQPARDPQRGRQPKIRHRRRISARPRARARAPPRQRPTRRRVVVINRARNSASSRERRPVCTPGGGGALSRRRASLLRITSVACRDLESYAIDAVLMFAAGSKVKC